MRLYVLPLDSGRYIYIHLKNIVLRYWATMIKTALLCHYKENFQPSLLIFFKAFLCLSVRLWLKSIYRFDFFCTKYNNPIFTGRLFLALVVYQRPQRPQRPNWLPRWGPPTSAPGALAALAAPACPSLSDRLWGSRRYRRLLGRGRRRRGGGRNHILQPGPLVPRAGWFLRKHTRKNTCQLSLGLKFKVKHFREK